MLSLNILASIAVLVMPVVGYSSGVALRNRKSKLRKISIFDLFVVAMMWAGVLYSRKGIHFSPWFLLLAWIGTGVILGYLASLIMGFSRTEPQEHEFHKKEMSTQKKKKILGWHDFSYKIGIFQSQILLGFLFLVLFSPVGFAIRLFSDPLNTKCLNRRSHWLAKKTTLLDIELYKKQG